MNLTLHMVRKDLRRLWIPLALFAALIVAKLAVGAFLLGGQGKLDFELFQKMQIYTVLLIALEVLVGYVLVSAVVLEDNLIGTRAFWMTKPISGGRLLGAKCTTLAAIFGVLPVLLTLPWWLVCGFGPRELAVAAVGTLLWESAVVLVALPIATLTGTFSRYLTWTTVGLMLVVLTSVYRSTGSIPELENVISPGANATRLTVATLLALLGTAVVVIHQYRTRLFWRSLGCFVASVAAVWIVVCLWPWDWSPLWDRPWGTAAGVSRDVVLTVGTAEVRTPRNQEPFPSITVSVVARGIPSGYVLAGERNRHDWQWAGGPQLSRDWHYFNWEPTPMAVGPLLNLPAPKPDPAFAKQQARVYFERFKRVMPEAPPAEPDRQQFQSASPIPRTAAARMQQEPPAYHLEGRFRLLKTVLVGEGPLREGSVLGHGPRQARIVHTKIDENHRMLISLVERTPDPATANFQSFLQGGPWGALRDAQIYWALDHAAFWLVNRTRQNANSQRYDSTRVMPIAGVNILWRINSISPQYDWDPQTEKFIEEPDWFAGATLVYFVNEPVETLRREARTDKLEVHVDPAVLARQK